jgi:hypothetical protein
VLLCMDCGRAWLSCSTGLSTARQVLALVLFLCQDAWQGLCCSCGRQAFATRLKLLCDKDCAVCMTRRLQCVVVCRHFL